MEVAAVIFDLNGTVIDDEHLYADAFNEVLTKLGVESNKEHPHSLGIGVKENWQKFVKEYNIKTKRSIEELTKQTQDIYLSNIKDISFREGFEDLIEDLRDNRITTALATSNAWYIVEEIVEELELDKYFDCLTTAEEVDINKPEPDIFIITAEKMGLEPGTCVVIEDSVAGITAGKRAGMRTVALIKDEDHESGIKGADLNIHDFSEVNARVLQTLR